MVKIIFKEPEPRVHVALLDVTKKAEEIFGDIEKAFIEINRFYEEFGEDVNKWKLDMEDNSYIHKDFIEIPYEHLYVKFKNGKVVNFYTSEYGQVSNRATNIF